MTIEERLEKLEKENLELKKKINEIIFALWEDLQHELSFPTIIKKLKLEEKND